MKGSVLCSVIIGFILLFSAFSVTAHDGNPHPDSSHSVEHFMLGSVKIIKDGSPLQGATVVLFDQSITTDAQGVAAFEHVKTGDHLLRVVQDSTVYEQKISITEPNTTVTLTASGIDFDPRILSLAQTTETAMKGFNWNWLIVGGGGILLVIAIILLAQNQFIATAAVRVTFAFAIAVLAGGAMVSFVQTNSSGARADSITYTDSIPMPENVMVIQDDRVATLTWNKQGTFWTDWDSLGERRQPDGSRLGGYYIRWGKKGMGLPTKQYTKFESIQLQPLEEGVEYELEIHTIDKRGNISRPVKIFTTARLDETGAVIDKVSAQQIFKSDSRRIAAHRSKMTGFFEDFNRPAGLFDELKWNNAYLAADARYSGLFINTQYHGHNQVTSGFEDRSANVVRARSIFDFRNREGTIVFDQDGSFSRDQWYLDIVSADSRYLGDIVANGGEKTPVTKMIRVHVDGKVQYPNEDGEFQDLPRTNCSWGPMCGGDSSGQGEINISSIPNVREPWMIKLSKPTATTMRVKVFIRGRLITDNQVPLGNRSFDRASLIYTFFSYNTTKGHLIASLNHWDNFGFDGPKELYPGTSQPLVTHNYRTDPAVSMQEDRDNGQRRDIFIPAYSKPATGKARLHYTFQTGDFWNTDSRVLINNTPVALPKPAIDSGGSRYPLSNAKWGYTEAVVLNPDILKSGLNTIEFRTGSRYVYNVHVELDYPENAVPQFYPPNEIAKLRNSYEEVYIPSVSPIGPLVELQTIGQYSVWNLIHGSDNTPKNITYVEYTNDDPYYKSTWTYAQSKPFNKILPVGFKIDSFTRQVATGADIGIIRYEFVFDNQPARPVHITDTNTVVPVPIIEEKRDIDISMLCNGKHTLLIRAYNSLGEFKVPFHIYYGPLVFWSTGGSAGNCPSDNSHIASSEPPSSLTNFPTAAAPTATPIPVPTDSNLPSPTPTITPGGPEPTRTLPSPTITPNATVTPSLNPSTPPSPTQTPILTISSPSLTLTPTSIITQSITQIPQGTISVAPSVTIAPTILPSPTVMTLSGTPVPSRIYVPQISPTLTQAAPTGDQSTCPRKREGDANCDGSINLLDHEIFRAEYLKEWNSLQADFNGDGKVSLLDVEIWIQTFIRGNQ